MTGTRVLQRSLLVLALLGAAPASWADRKSVV